MCNFFIVIPPGELFVLLLFSPDLPFIFTRTFLLSLPCTFLTKALGKSYIETKKGHPYSSASTCNFPLLFISQFMEVPNTKATYRLIVVVIADQQVHILGLINVTTKRLTRSLPNLFLVWPK